MRKANINIIPILKMFLPHAIFWRPSILDVVASSGKRLYCNAMNTFIHFRWHSAPGPSVILTSAVRNINFNHTGRLDDPLCRKQGTSAPLGKHSPFQVHLGIGLTSVNVSFLSCFYLWYQRKTKSKLILLFFFFLLLVTYLTVWDFTFHFCQ